MGKSISEVEVEDLIKAGLSIEEAKHFQRVLKDLVNGAKGSDPSEVWRHLVARRVLKPSHPHGVHQLVYYSVYANWDVLLCVRICLYLYCGNSILLQNTYYVLNLRR